MGAKRPNGMPDDALDLIRHTHAAVSQIEKTMPVLASQLEAFGKLAERNAEIIDGNGGEGIITRLRLAEKEMERYLRLSEDQAKAVVQTTSWHNITRIEIAKAIGAAMVAASAFASLAMQFLGG